MNGIKRPRQNTPLRKWLPWGYQKDVMEMMDLPMNGRTSVLISQSLTGKNSRKKEREIRETISWIALGNVMNKLFSL